MIIKLLLILLFNIIYSLNNYSNLIDIVIINIILFFIEFIIINEKIIISKKHILISLIISIIILFINKVNFIYGYDSKNIEIIGNDFSIDSLYINDSKIKLNDYGIYNQNPYDIYNKLTEYYKLENINYYYFNTEKAHSIVINFEKDKQDYDVLINDEKIKINKSTVDKNSDYYKVYDNYYTYKIDNINYSNNKRIINIIISFIFINIIILSVINSINKKDVSKLFLLFSLFILEFNSYINISIIYKSILFILFYVMSRIIRKNINIELLRKNFLKEYLASLIISFQFIGTILMDNKININLIILYLLLSILIFIVIITLENLKLNYILVNKNQNSTLKTKIILFMIPLIACISYLIIYKTFILTTDGSMQLNEIKNNLITNWHPFFHTVILKIFYNINHNLNLFIIVRIIIVSLLISNISTYFIDKYVNKKMIYILVFIICINPIFSIYMISLLKDVDFIIFFIMLTFLIIKYLNNNFKVMDYFYLLISLIFIGMFRHNGIYIAVIMIIALFIIFYIKKDIRLLISMIICSFFLIFLNTFFYNYLEIKPGIKNVDIAALAHGLQAIYIENNDCKIKEIFTDYSSFELKDNYSKYNIDVLLHYNNIQLRNMDIDKLEFMNICLKNLFKYPNILIKDRLNGTNILWDIFSSDKIQTYNYQIIENEFGYSNYEKNKIKISQNKLSNIIEKIIMYESTNKFLNFIFFRSGIYLSLMIILTVSNWNKKNLFILFPTIIYILTLFISLHHQSYRYVMFIPFIFIIYLLNILANNKQNVNKCIVVRK